MEGEEVTGVSIIDVDPKAFDSGCILSQVETPILPGETYSSLTDRLIEQGARQLVQVIENYDESKRNKTEQVGPSSSAFKLKKEDRLIDFNKYTAKEVWNRWRGLNENGGIFTYFGRKRVNLKQVSIPSAVSLSELATGEQAPGEIYGNRKAGLLLVRCADGSYVQLDSVQVEGKKVITPDAFINGYCGGGGKSFTGGL
mmetsp:Transcript_14865/g.24199  ORF Transcript_14865/g.24199 Transcript_14865/m.24199 type:complete len:199 (-) Transcript_14865:1971-2567(-)